MKRLTLSIVTTCFLSFGVPNSINAGGIPTIDVAAIAQHIQSYSQQLKDYTMQIQQYEQMYSQLQQQLRMVEMQTTNLKNLANYDWKDLGSVLQQSRMIMNRIDAISYDAGNMSNKFENTYKDFNSYKDDFSSASNENSRNQLFSDRYKQIRETNQNTMNGTLQKLELSYKELDNESKEINNLKDRSAKAEGNLQVLQASNDLLAYQIDEARKLRVTMMDQTNAMTNYMAAQNNEKILGQARDEAIDNKANRRNIYDTKDDMSQFVRKVK